MDTLFVTLILNVADTILISNLGLASVTVMRCSPHLQVFPSPTSVPLTYKLSPCDITPTLVTSHLQVITFLQDV